MASNVIYERFIWFHDAVKAGRYPTARTMAEQFEISRKTAQRNIEFMRDRLHAPFVYSHLHRGYVYDDHAWELPANWLREEELISLLVAYRLASAIPGKAMKEALKSLLETTLSRLSHPYPLSITDLSDKVSIKNIEYSRANERIFNQILQSLLVSKPITIEYYSPHKNESTTRHILPLHLLNYNGTWHVVAHCDLKQEIRDFVLSRISSCESSPVPIETSKSPAEAREYVRQHFGIMTGSETIEVCLRFSPAVSPWLAEQVWHPAQQEEWGDDKTLCLTFPVADFREIKREILKYGADVEVVTPMELREDIMREIEKMVKVYE